MSFLFICGESGCQALEVDEEARKYADRKTGQWAWGRKRKTGDFPRSREQVRYYACAYQRYKSIAGQKGLFE